jgi:quercetin dioxygenase-like cupin family protein
MTPREPMHLADWAELERVAVRPGVSRSAFGNDDVLLVRNVLEPGMEINAHVHEFDQIALVVEGHATFFLDGEPYDMPPGSILLIPAGVAHHAEPVGDRPVVNVDVFAPVREDYRHLLDWMQAGAQ